MFGSIYKSLFDLCLQFPFHCRDRQKEGWVGDAFPSIARQEEGWVGDASYYPWQNAV